MQSAPKGGGEPGVRGLGRHAAPPEGRRPSPSSEIRHATPSLPAQPWLTEGTFHPPRQPDLDTKDIARLGENPGRADTTFPPLFFGPRYLSSVYCAPGTISMCIERPLKLIFQYIYTVIISAC